MIQNNTEFIKPYNSAPDFGEFIGQLFDKNSLTRVNLSCRTITFQVTESCNLRCSYCYEHNKGTKMMSFEVGKAVVDALFNEDKGLGEYLHLSDTLGIILDFIGGETFLNVKVIDQIIDYFEEMTIITGKWKNMWKASIITNGTIYDDEVKAFLDKHKNHLSFSVTIDGNKQLHDSCRVFPDGSGSYDLAAATAIDRLSKGEYVGSKLTLAHENLPYLSDAVKNMIDLGITDLRGNCVFEDVWKEGDATIYYNELKKVADYFLDSKIYNRAAFTVFNKDFYGPSTASENKNYCGGTGEMIAFDPNGIAYPCLRYMPTSLGPNVKPPVIGDIYRGLMIDDDQRNTVKCLKCITRRSQSTDECFYCPIGKGCGWCSALNYEICGTANKRTTYNCEMHKAEALANVYYWNKLGVEQFPLYVPKEWALKIISESEYEMLCNLSHSRPMTVEEAYAFSKEYSKKIIEKGRGK